uniref:Uncharacterized protein n=1 Tax=Plectus sambesii TaxID=2011161 RepID=A0A914V9V2_9BILA
MRACAGRSARPQAERPHPSNSSPSSYVYSARDNLLALAGRLIARETVLAIRARCAILSPGRRANRPVWPHRGAVPYAVMRSSVGRPLSCRRASGTKKGARRGATKTVAHEIEPTHHQPVWERSRRPD